MRMYNLIEYGDNYLKTSGSLGNSTEMNQLWIMMASLLMFLMSPIMLDLNMKKITGQTGNDGEKNVQMTVSLKYLSNFSRTLEISLINWEINIFLHGLKNIL